MSTTTTEREVGPARARIEQGAPLPLPPTVEAAVERTASGLRVVVSRTLVCSSIRRTRARRVLVRESHVTPAAMVTAGVLAAIGYAIFFAPDADDGSATLGTGFIATGGITYAGSAAQAGSETSELPPRETAEPAQLSPCSTGPVSGAEVVVAFADRELKGRTDARGVVTFAESPPRAFGIFVDGQPARIRHERSAP